MKSRFNLIEQDWVPVADAGRVSLRRLFSQPQFRALGGNPVQKISLMRLLLAVAQAACTPEDDAQWQALGSQGLARHCLAYLEKWHDRFDLYGERPFLQMPAIVQARVQSFGAVLPEVATGNTTILHQTQIARVLDDADKALLLISLMGFALGGKKTDNSVTLSPGYSGKLNDKGRPSSSKPGPAVAHFGLLHSFLLGNNLWQSLWLNVLTHQQIKQTGLFEQGVGMAPWEQMPDGEACARAEQLKRSLMGRLLPLSRFCLLTDRGLHYSEGIAHPGYKDGMTDLSTAVDYSGKPKALWVDPEKRPWRELTALLSFIAAGSVQGYQCMQLRAGLGRARREMPSFFLWSGGLRVSSNAGEQYVSGSDDFVESQVELHSHDLGEGWFVRLKTEMSALDEVSKWLYGKVSAFFKEQKMDGSRLASEATRVFWQLCERDFQVLIDHCDASEASRSRRKQLRLRFADYVQQTYNRYCPHETARQLDAWAKCRPNMGKYLKQKD